MQFSFIEFYVRLLGEMMLHTGVIGAYEFKDGVSVRKLFRNEAEQLAAIGFRCEAVGLKDGQVEPIFEVIPGQVPMPDAAVDEVHKNYIASRSGEKTPTKVVDESELTDSDETDSDSADTSDSEELTEPTTVLTRDYLESVADSSGLKGLRKIGKQYDVKGKSIPELIERLLQKQG